MKSKKPEIKRRNKEVTRKKILDTAFWLFYSRSFNDVSIDDITKTAGITKGALFHYFKNKKELGYAVVDEVLKPTTEQKWIKPLEKFDNSLDGILTCIDTHMIHSPKEFIPLGCPLNNLIQEVSNTNPIFRKKLSEVLDIWIEGVNTHLKRSQKLGYINKNQNTKSLAKFIVSSQEGAYGMSKSYQNGDIFRMLHKSLSSYFESIST
jgi:TetR/AcrR family transcriptional regulator, transcriptional repressor for nem operon